MSGPVIYVGTHTIRQAKLEAAREGSSALVEFLRANHPHVVHFGIYIDEPSHLMTVIQVHPDEESLFLHLRLAGEKIAAAHEFLEGTTGIDIYGTPSDSLVELVQTMARGAPVRFKTPDAGFSRMTQGAASTV